jgi:hypothetical protein
MSLDEVESIIRNNTNKNKDEWERVRTGCFYALISYNGTKVFKKPKDVFPLPWDNEKKKEVIVDKAKVEKKLKKAERFLNGTK